MRNKKCMYQMLSWIFYRPHKCCYCDKDAIGTLRANAIFRRYERDLCEEHLHQWMKGELHI